MALIGEDKRPVKSEQSYPMVKSGWYWHDKHGRVRVVQSTTRQGIAVKLELAPNDPPIIVSRRSLGADETPIRKYLVA